MLCLKVSWQISLWVSQKLLDNQETHTPLGTLREKHCEMLTFDPFSGMDSGNSVTYRHTHYYIVGDCYYNTSVM